MPRTGPLGVACAESMPSVQEWPTTVPAGGQVLGGRDPNFLIEKVGSPPPSGGYGCMPVSPVRQHPSRSAISDISEENTVPQPSDAPCDRPGLPDRLFFTVEEAAALLGISRTLGYALAREYLATGASGLPCVRIGSRRIVVSRRTLERMADAEPGLASDPNDAA